MSHNIVAAIVGPTGVGKSSLANRLAMELNGEIISADSRQVYRHMDIGTGKPLLRDRSEIPHHLIDVANPDEEYSLAIFLREARSAIRDIFSRSKFPIICGGTGQYIWALLEGWQVPFVPPDPDLRASLYDRIREEGIESIHKELSEIEPIAAKKIDPLNPRRVIRALEIIHADRVKQNKPRRLKPDFNSLIIGLTSGKDQLHQRINSRVDSMINDGWLSEVEWLLNQGYDQNLPSMSSVGYRELTQHLKGEVTLQEAVCSIKRRTRKLARRQRNWFRSCDDRIKWFDDHHQAFAGAVSLIEIKCASENPR